MQWQLMKNFIIVIVGAILVVVVLNKINHPTDTSAVSDPSPIFPTAPVETNLTSIHGINIYIENLKDGDSIENPLVIRGRAPGNWFFEASAPVVLTDWDGLIIAEGYVTAEGEWMTTEYVPFSGTLTFVKPVYGERGTLIFQKNNPSGESKFDDAAEMTIMFK